MKMGMNLSILFAGGVCAVALVFHVASIVAVIVRLKWRDASTPTMASASAGVSILRPVCGIEKGRSDPEDKG